MAHLGNTPSVRVAMVQCMCVQRVLLHQSHVCVEDHLRAVNLQSELVLGQWTLGILSPFELAPHGSRVACVFYVYVSVPRCAGRLQRMHLWAMTYKPVAHVFSGGSAPRHGIGQVVQSDCASTVRHVVCMYGLRASIGFWGGLVACT
jgi:hypothetical protein